MIKDWKQTKFEKALLVLWDYKTRLDRESTVKEIDQPGHTSRRYFQIKFYVSYIKLYMDRLEMIYYVKHW